MSTFLSKSRRTSAEQSSPRGAGGRKSKVKFPPRCPGSSSSQSPSPPRRHDSLKDIVLNVVRPRSVAVSAQVVNYRGVRYRKELNKYVSEIRPTRCSKKIWLGTFDYAEEAARAFDIGNLCCNKNLPLNFQDSPTMLKRISSKLSPAEARSAIAKLAKEVARLGVDNSSSNGGLSAATREPVDQVAVSERHELVHPQEFQPRYEPEFVQVQHLASVEIPSNMYFEQLDENIESAMEVATAMPIGCGGETRSRSWSFHMSDVSLRDDLDDIPILVDTPSIDQDHDYGDVFFYSHFDQTSN